MNAPIAAVDGGTITTPGGFRAGAVYAGMKTPGPGKLDLGILVSDTPCTVAGVFSRSSIVSPSLGHTRERVRSGDSARGFVVNSGCANACVGEPGFTDAQEVVKLAAEQVGADPDEMLICSTGVIGVELPMALIREHMPEVELASDAGERLARAIMTTDTRPKQLAVSVEIGGAEVTVGGIAKGSGMIHPDMATLLVFMTTDAAVEQGFLRQTLGEAVADSFNMVDIDTDSSTNDTCLLLANGAAGNAPLVASSAGADDFAAAVRHVAIYLAKEIARDGEGATKLIEVNVSGAQSEQDARVAARSVSSSPLVKTAVYGRDPNWGRILMAIGKTGIPVDESKIQVYINDIQIVEGGGAIPFHTASVVAALGEPEVYLRIALNLGEATATAWGCDLTEEYVVFNSAYTT